MIKRILNKVFSGSNKVKFQSAERLTLTVKIPFFRNKSFFIRKDIKDVIKEYFSQVKLSIIFINKFRIKILFLVKDVLQDRARCSVIYKFNCCRCDASYIGKTSRHLFTRISEHLGRSFRTNNILLNPPNSAIRDHSIEFDHSIKADNFKIINTATTDFDLSIK